MAPTAQTRNKPTRNSTGNDNKATGAAFTPTKRLVRTPPPSSIPIAGTPISQPDTSPAEMSNPSPQTATQKSAVANAQDALNVALKHLNEAYQKAGTKLKQGEDPSATTVETPFRIFEEIGKKVGEALYHLSRQATQSEELGEHFSRLEQTLKETIASTAAKTYAQVAAKPTIETNRTREIQQNNLERKVEKRREQAILTTHGANLDTKEQLAQETHREITAKLQRTMESQLKENRPAIYGVQKLKSQDIRIHCDTIEEAEQLRKLKWDQEYEGLTVRHPKYGIRISAVPTNSIDPGKLKDPKTTRELENQNDGIRIIEMKPLRRKVRDNASHYDLVVFLTDPQMANACIKHGIYIDHQRFLPEKYVPQFQLTQCYKCQRFGHHATVCKSPHDVCAKCSEHHPTPECTNETHKCAGCKGEHPAWHQDCAHRTSEIQNLRTRKRNAPVYFNE
jgi:hypothetical protein